MIVLELQGRLGNQLFEIFTLISAAIETQQSFAVYLKPIGTNNSYWDTLFKKMYPRHVFSTKLRPKFIHNDNFLSFVHLLHGYRGFVCQINGFFQKLVYMEKHFDTIYQFLEFPELREQVCKKVSKQMPFITNWGQTISMHFRLGDYLSQQESYPVMPYQYYFDALKYIVRSYLKVKQIIYFCEVNDLFIVNPMIQKLSEAFPQLEFYKIIDGLQDWEELFAMSCCKHHIIANSTFSWWGAYLNQPFDYRTVCYPSLWVGPKLKKTFNVDGAFPDSWTKIQVN